MAGMFTGIIQYVGTVRRVHPAGAGRRIRIELGPLAEGLAPGDSVAVNGACLTASAIDGAEAEFDAVAETVSRTTLGRLTAGAKVNLERALRAGQGLDGHIVQGHVDGAATLRRVRRGSDWRLEFAAPAELIAQMVPKGSVAVDGVSLTLAGVERDSFSVAIIPTTLSETTLAGLREGEPVNVETDVIGKYVLSYLQRMGGGGGGRLTMEKLRNAGFG